MHQGLNMTGSSGGKSLPHKRPSGMPEQAHHHLGLEHDLKMIMSRRRTLSILGGGGSAMLLASCAGDGSDSATPSATASSTPTPTPTPTPTSTATGSPTSSDCVSYSEETNGPYPADGSNTANGAVANVLIDSGIVRSDMRSSFNGLTGTAPGVDVELTITLNNVNNSCAALAGYAIYVWHCDAEGLYSVYNLADENYLRAVGVTDSNGQVTFTTIFPGCYSGRWPHIHFEVYESLNDATHYSNRILCSQMAMPADESSYVYSVSSDYSGSSSNFSRITIASDNVFGDNSDDEIEAQTLTMDGDATGYTATVTVGLAV